MYASYGTKTTLVTRPSQVLRSGRRGHVNIPHHCWAQMADVFASFAREMPLSSEESGASGSEND